MPTGRHDSRGWLLDGASLVRKCVFPYGIGAVLSFNGTYIYDKKNSEQDIVKLRTTMQQHFGVAIDPYACLTNLQQEIDQKSQAGATESLDTHWYKSAIQDAFADKQTLQLALLRARCDQQDLPLQQLVLNKVARAA